MTGQSPRHQPGDDRFAVARALLQAEADQRGISLVDRLARQGRMPAGPIAPQPPIDVIEDKVHGLTRPPWADTAKAWAGRSRHGR